MIERLRGSIRKYMAKVFSQARASSGFDRKSCE